MNYNKYYLLCGKNKVVETTLIDLALLGDAKELPGFSNVYTSDREDVNTSGLIKYDFDAGAAPKSGKISFSPATNYICTCR